MASQVQDDAFHEIQLNGKQLVFLFMAATVVSVVIFLCGVLVGRNVRVERGVDVAASASPDITSTVAQPPAVTPAGSDPTAAAPPPAAADDLSYFNRLEKPTAPAEPLKSAAPADTPATTPPAPAPEAPPVAPAERSAPAVTPAPAAATLDPASRDREGFAVQIAALNERNEAEAIAQRLSSKGYAAYVLAPASGTPSVYRVRVGKFPTRREAESIAARLKREEQFNPWITR